MRTCWWRWGTRCLPWRPLWARTRTRPSLRSSTRRPSSSGCAAASRTACALQAQVWPLPGTEPGHVQNFREARMQPQWRMPMYCPLSTGEGTSQFLVDLISSAHLEGSGGPL